MKNVSVIVPVYNVEKYLSRCLDSILSQTMRDIEIILVNDGSKDSSLEICRSYAEKDSRIVVIDKKNEGVSVARNAGIDAAKGTYVGFVDPDDWIEPRMYESMYNTIEKYGCCMALCNYIKDSKFSITVKTIKVNRDVLGKLDIINELIANMVGMEDILPKYSNVMGCVWRCLYRRDFLNDFNLRFKPGISIMEDLLFNVQSLVYCDRVCIDHGVYYHYMRNKTSSLRTYNNKMWQDFKKVHNTLEEILEDADLEEYMRNRLDSRYIAMAACAVGNEIYRNSTKLRERMHTAKYIIQDEKLKEVLERTRQYNFENLRDLAGSKVSAKERAVVRNLLFYSGSNPDRMEPTASRRQKRPKRR
ncbi:MAG: glycosyltransferase [Sedimentibacter sp.]|uniref:glycosyltransferase n=1 Tax=Sedimentibacter sp. TaxID=1960295 RepID=UPI003158CC8E